MTDSYRSYQRTVGQHVAKAWGAPVFAALPTHALDAVLALHHTAIATALPILATAQTHAIKHDLRDSPITVRASMRWLAEVTPLDLRTVLDALDELRRPLPDGWPPIFDSVTTRQREINVTIAPPWSCPHDHVRIPARLPTATRGAAKIAILIAESARLSWPGNLATRIDFRASEHSVEAFNQHLRRTDHSTLERYNIHWPRAVRQRVRERLTGPATVMGVELEF